MKITFNIDYRTQWGEELCIVGLNGADQAIPMSCQNTSNWSVSVDVGKSKTLKYTFELKDAQGYSIRKESQAHVLKIDSDKDCLINNVWLEKPQSYWLSSPFKNCFFKHNYKQQVLENGTLLKVRCYEVESHQTVAVLGQSFLGDWGQEKIICLSPSEYGFWETTLPCTDRPLEYKFAIVDSQTKEIVRWESGENRLLQPNDDSQLRVEEILFEEGSFRWKCAGVAIPVFSLRTRNSFGVGEFLDLKEMVDWAALVGQRIIQVLPINDTSMTGTWVDSYPYKAISIYALHPIYFGVKEYPLRDKKKSKRFKEEGDRLNALPVLDYEKVIKLKREYLHELFIEKRDAITKSKDYKSFLSSNEDWLFPYACFCYFRDKKKTANYRNWGGYAVYDELKLRKLFAKDASVSDYIKEVYFIQYLLQKQLKTVREYAINKGVVLKGDIPIGISRDSVEAWVEPHLFNLDTQTGAPPDDFAVEGQNWGFPTYNWSEMSKDGYKWWTKRFRKMAEYFDVYRIDHILGFFRIWEIPLNAVQGLLGYFSPALPLSLDDMRARGLYLSLDRMTEPFIDSTLVCREFGEKVEYAKAKYLDDLGNGLFHLKVDFDTQQKIKTQVDEDEIRQKLYSLCANVLFVQDKQQPDRLHPRISAQKTYSYFVLNDEGKRAFDAIYEDFFFRRHSEFWKIEAMKKLPALISSTEMLVCGEDLGMIPASVPEVMADLEILSLEIQRMPKTYGVQFEDLSRIPYRSVCATSTHDMPPIRLWWSENRELAQSYYNNVLKKEGAAPTECSADLCREILELHLSSPAMLSIHPLQDWLSINAGLRRRNEGEEQINIPANPTHYWRYRMHLSLEDLLSETAFAKELSKIMLNHKQGCNENK